jgi:hypothetical protein
MHCKRTDDLGKKGLTETLVGWLGNGRFTMCDIVSFPFGNHMNFLSRYIRYLKDNPEQYWFKRKAYGWGVGSRNLARVADARGISWHFPLAFRAVCEWSCTNGDRNFLVSNKNTGMGCRPYWGFVLHRRAA